MNINNIQQNPNKTTLAFKDVENFLIYSPNHERMSTHERKT